MFFFWVERLKPYSYLLKYLRSSSSSISVMGNNCIGISIEKEETITEHLQFLNQINLCETRYAHLNHKGKIICYCCRGHGLFGT